MSDDTLFGLDDKLFRSLVRFLKEVREQGHRQGYLEGYAAGPHNRANALFREGGEGDILAAKLYEVDIDLSITYPLMRHGVVTVKDLTEMTRADLLGVNCIGKGRVQAIEEWLAQYRLGLRAG